MNRPEDKKDRATRISSDNYETIAALAKAERRSRKTIVGIALENYFKLKKKRIRKEKAC